MESRITKLETTITSLENSLKQLQKEEADAKSVTEKASGDIGQWEEEVKGTVSVTLAIFFGKMNSIINLHSLLSIICFILFMVHIEWKTKLEECEKEIQDWKKRSSAAATSISKLKRQLNSKVSLTVILI